MVRILGIVSVIFFLLRRELVGLRIEHERQPFPGDIVGRKIVSRFQEIETLRVVSHMEGTGCSIDRSACVYREVMIFIGRSGFLILFPSVVACIGAMVHGMLKLGSSAVSVELPVADRAQDARILRFYVSDDSDLLEPFILQAHHLLVGRGDEPERLEFLKELPFYAACEIDRVLLDSALPILRVPILEDDHAGEFFLQMRDDSDHIRADRIAQVIDLSDADDVLFGIVGADIVDGFLKGAPYRLQRHDGGIAFIEDIEDNPSIFLRQGEYPT